MRAIQIVELSGPESLQLADIAGAERRGRRDRRPRRRRVVPRGAAVARAVPDQAGPAVRAGQRGRRAWCGERRTAPRSREGDRVAAFCMLGGFAEVALAPAALHVQAAGRARLRAGRRADPQLPHGVLRAEAARAPAPRARPCSCTAPPAASGRRRCRWRRASGARTIAVVSTDEKERSRARRAPTRCCAPTATGRTPAKELSAAASTSCSTRSAATASRTACARCAATGARRRRLHRRLDPRGARQPAAAEQHRRRRRGLGRVHRTASRR